MSDETLGDSMGDVWISGAIRDTQLVKSFENNLQLSDRKNSLDIALANQAGESIPQERMPTEIYFKYSDVDSPELPYFCMAGGWVVNEKLADLLSQFDLGGGGVYPLKAFQNDRVTPVEGTYFCLNFGNTKEAFVPEQSPNARLRHEGVEIWVPPFVINDNDIVVRQSALEGPDIWVDPKLARAFFISDRLAKALKAAKLATRFRLKKCRVIRMH